MKISTEILTFPQILFKKAFFENPMRYESYVDFYWAKASDNVWYCC